MLKAYKYRLLPTEDQKATFANWFGACRFIYNIALEVKGYAWKTAGKQRLKRLLLAKGIEGEIAILKLNV